MMKNQLMQSSISALMSGCPAPDPSRDGYSSVFFPVILYNQNTFPRRRDSVTWCAIVWGMSRIYFNAVDLSATRAFWLRFRYASNGAWASSRCHITRRPISFRPFGPPSDSQTFGSAAVSRGVIRQSELCAMSRSKIHGNCDQYQ